MRTHRLAAVLFASAVLAAAFVLAGGSGYPAFAAGPSSAGREGYYRFPAIHGDLVVFTSEGDLWSVPAGGGLARRLTSHQGIESQAAISPDGSTIAFTGQYEGPTEVYTMPIDGGLPRPADFLRPVRRSRRLDTRLQDRHGHGEILRPSRPTTRARRSRER